MRKLFISLISILFLVVLATSAYSMTLAWDTYSDPLAEELRIYSSTDQSTWVELVLGIPTNLVASEVPTHTTDNERVYYMMRAFGNGEESANSGSVSYFWSSGGGTVGPSGVGGIRLLDCSTYDTIPDDGSTEWALCEGRHTP